MSEPDYRNDRRFDKTVSSETASMAVLRTLEANGYDVTGVHAPTSEATLGPEKENVALEGPATVQYTPTGWQYHESVNVWYEIRPTSRGMDGYDFNTLGVTVWVPDGDE